MKKFRIKEVDSIVDNFSECASDISKKTNSVMQMIGEGKVPTQSELSDMMAVYSDLRNCYEKMQDLVKKYCTDSEALRENAPIEFYAEQVAEVKRKELAEQIKRAKIVLNKFITVVSSNEFYSNLLEPYKVNAKAMLKELDTEFDDYFMDSETYLGSVAFTNTLALENYESEEELSVMDEFAKYFPRTVERGVIRNLYTYEGSDKKEETPIPLPTVKASEDNNACEVEKLDDSPKTKLTEEEKKSIEIQTDKLLFNNAKNADSEEIAKDNQQNIEENTLPEAEKAEVVEENNTVSGVEEPVSVEEIPEKEEEKAEEVTETTENEETTETVVETFEDNTEVTEEKDFEKIPETEPEDDESGEVLELLNPVKKAQPSATGFKKEIRSLSYEARSILACLTWWSCATMTDIKEIFNHFLSVERKNNAEVAVDFLLNKKLIGKFNLDGENIYCITPYSLGSLKKDSIRYGGVLKIDLSIGDAKFCADSATSKNKIQNILLRRKTQSDYVMRYNDKDKRVKHLTTKYAGRYYTIAVDFKGENYTCYCYSPDMKCKYENLLYVGSPTEDTVFPPHDNLFILNDGVLSMNGIIDEDSRKNYIQNYSWEELDEADKDSDVEVSEDKAETTAIPDSEVKLEETEKTAEIEEVNEVNNENTEKAEETKEIEESAETADSSEPETEDKEETLEDEKEVQEEDFNTEIDNGSVTDLDSKFEEDEKEINIEPKEVFEDTYRAEEVAELSEEKTESKEPAEEVEDNIITQVLAKKERPDDDTFVSIINDLKDGKLYSKGNGYDIMRADLLAYTASMYNENEKSEKLYKRLSLATGIKFSKVNNDSLSLLTLFGINNDECMTLAACLQALVLPNDPYDYSLYELVDGYYNDYENKFPNLAFAKKLFKKFADIRKVTQIGFTAPLVSILADEKTKKEQTARLERKATDLLTVELSKIKMEDLNPLLKDVFGNGSEFYSCMNIIASNNVRKVEDVEKVLNEYLVAEGGETTIDVGKVKNKVRSEWERHSKISLREKSRAENCIKYEYLKRLEVMKEWVDINALLKHIKLDMNVVGKFKNELLTLISETLNKIKTLNIENANVLSLSLNNIEHYLKNDKMTKDLYSEFMISGVFSTDENGMPIINEAFKNIDYYEPWRNALRHITSKISSFDSALENIQDLRSPLFDNLNQLRNILIKTGREDSVSDVDKNIEEARTSAKDRKKEFKEELELDFTYSRIDENEKERILSIVDSYEEEFFEREDFGCWSRFLDAFKQQAEELAEKKKSVLKTHIEERRAKLGENEVSSMLGEAEVFLERERNFAVCEEYIDRFDNGEKDLPTEKLSMYDKDNFAEFLSDEVFVPLQKECEQYRGKLLKSFAWRYLEDKIDKKWTSRQKDDCQKFIENWPIRKGSTKPANIKTLLISLGFNISEVSCLNSVSNVEVYKVIADPEKKSKADYLHPISIFGTQIQNPINVVVFYGNPQPSELVDTMTSMNHGSMSIVFVDHYIDRAQRRQIAEIFHNKTTGQNPFIFIDRILMLYLAEHQITERLPIMLKCTLPYTTYQPFVRGSGSTADEMFCGRTKELNAIIDPKGASVVYGGRQLGKTALLQRAESRCHKPEDKNFAVYVNIVDCDSEEAFIKKIMTDIRRKTGLKFQSVNTISDLTARITNYFESKKINSLMLLIDEADKFLDSISGDKYKALQPLIDTKRETANKFKFVIAGLHNVCRAQNATAENGVFGQLGAPLCIEPLSPKDALELLTRPLKYLGFRNEEHGHFETILTNTNYYPGILQFFGYMLVEECNSNYSKYYSATNGNPPFTLLDDQLGSIMDSRDLNTSIKDKFKLSLDLDKRYLMLARCIAALYYLSDEGSAERWDGYSSNKIIDFIKDYNILCLKDESKKEIENLLDEMTSMGILSHPNDLYRIRKNSFIGIIGANLDEVFNDITTANEENEND